MVRSHRLQSRSEFTPVADGASTGTLAIAEESGRFDPAAVEAVAEPTGGGFTLRGAKHFVFEPLVADELVVVARLPGTSGDQGVGAFVVPGDAVSVTALPSVDMSRVVGTVELRGLRVGADRMLGEPGPEVAAALRRASDEAIRLGINAKDRKSVVARTHSDIALLIRSLMEDPA